MDWRIAVTTFSAIFVAELADKTQLVSISLAAKSGKPWIVWSASVFAYMLVTLMSVFIGFAFGQYLQPQVLRMCGAVIFIAMGIFILTGKL